MKCKKPGCEKEEVKGKTGFCSDSCRRSSYSRIRGKKNKIKAVKYKGGCCEICGYSKNMAALQFHHTNSKEKEFSVSKLLKEHSWELAEKELEKCVLVCANCHAELHEQEVSFAEEWTRLAEKELLNEKPPKKMNLPPPEELQKLLLEKSVRQVHLELNVHRDVITLYAKQHNLFLPTRKHFTEQIKNIPKETHNKEICDCGEYKSIGAIVCAKCRKELLEKINWPSDETMKELVWKFPRTKLAEMLGVSDRAISKRLQKRNIPQPPRGYWAKVQAGKT